MLSFRRVWLLLIDSRKMTESTVEPGQVETTVAGEGGVVDVEPSLRGARWNATGAAASGHLRQRGLGVPVGAPEPEAPFVGRKIEGRERVEFGRVVGEAPQERSGAACLAEAVDCSARVGGGRGLADKKRALEVAEVCRWQAELFEEDWGTAREPAGDLGEEGQQLVVGGPGRPVGIDRVAVHRDELAPAGGFGRADPAILLEVFHVDADRERPSRIAFPDRGGNSF